MALADQHAPSTIEYCYGRLGIRSEDLRLLPQITPQLRQIAQTIRRSGQPRVTRKMVDSRGQEHEILEYREHQAPYAPGADLTVSWAHYLRASDSPDAIKVLAAYDSVPKAVARRLPIEAFCLAASVGPLRILEIITGVCVRMGAQASTIIAAVNHPRVVEKTVEMALTDDGIEDRNTLHKATGFLPTPKGAQTTIQVVQNAQANAAARADAQTAAAPSAESTIRKLADRFNESRQLGAAQPTSVAALPAEREPDLLQANAPADSLAVDFDDSDPDDAEDDR